MRGQSNLVFGLMPTDVRTDLMETGTEFHIEAGAQVPRPELDGSYLFIVTSGMASKFQSSPDGRFSEIGLVGSEGMFPLSALLNVPASPHIVVSQSGILTGNRLRAKDFHRIIKGSDEAKDLVNRYIYAFITQVASNISASDTSRIEARIARWLLMCHDRVEGDELVVTHETLGQMAFAHRPTVTNILKRLKEDAVITMARGRIVIRSRSGLSAIANGTYGISERFWREHIGPFGKDG